MGSRLGTVPAEMDDLDALSQQQLLDSRTYDYFNGGNQRQEQDDLSLLNLLGGNTDGYGLSVPERTAPGQQEFNRLTTGSAMTLPQQRYLRTREAAQQATRNNRDASFEQQQLASTQRAAAMKFPPATVQGSFNPKHGQAIAFAKALGFGQQISASPQNAELAYQAMTTLLRRTPLPVLLSRERRQQTAMEFQLILEQMSKPQLASTGRPPVQPM